MSAEEARAVLLGLGAVLAIGVVATAVVWFVADRRDRKLAQEHIKTKGPI